MSDPNYKQAYERMRSARERAEAKLEEKSRELYAANEVLTNAYNTLQEQKEQLVHQEKLASIGLLAAGIAHEINNPVGFVKSNLQTLSDYTGSYWEILSAYKNLVAQLEASDYKDHFAKILNDIEALAKERDLDFIAKDGAQCVTESMEGIGTD